jgi:hypothetical protein
MHHQLTEHRLIADGLHPFLGAIELARCSTRATTVSFGRHLTDLWTRGDYALTVALMTEQFPGVAVWGRGGR